MSLRDNSYNLPKASFYPIHRWRPKCLRHALYPDADFKLLLNSSGHPSLRSSRHCCVQLLRTHVTRRQWTFYERGINTVRYTEKYRQVPEEERAVGMDVFRSRQPVQADTLNNYSHPVFQKIFETADVRMLSLFQNQSARASYTAIQTCGQSCTRV